jgi:hypothetical protein
MAGWVGTHFLRVRPGLLWEVAEGQAAGTIVMEILKPVRALLAVGSSSFARAL